MSAITQSSTAKDGLLKELFKLGAHFGFSRSRQHPSTQRFIFGFKNRQAVIDLEQTLTALQQAKTFLQSLGVARRLVLWVGTKNEARGAVEANALALGHPYVVDRWLGGTLTNFKEMRRRVKRLLELREQSANGELEKYTKKERAVIAKEREKLERYFGSLTSLSELPAALLVVDSATEAIAVAEAQKIGLPVVALANSDCDIRGLAYPIVGNDGAQGSIRYFLNELATAYRAGREEADRLPPPAAVR